MNAPPHDGRTVPAPPTDAVTARNSSRRTVVVVGAGVSGCAAALTLAHEGARVILVNSALDSVGLPGYGPLVDFSEQAGLVGTEGSGVGQTGESRIAGIVRALAGPVADAWLQHTWEAAGSVPLALVDRRAVSMAVKWRVENEPLIDLRQGIVIGLEECQRDGLEPRPAELTAVRTAFGERIEGDAVVVAVGLALGGRVRMGAQEQAGARLGEVGADGLFEALRSRGVRFDQAQVSVGMRLSAAGEGDRPWEEAPFNKRWSSLPEGSGLVETEFAPVTDGRVEGAWTPRERTGFVAPPSPYDHSRRPMTVLTAEGRDGGVPVSEADVVLAPDGIATGEWYAPARTDAGLSIDRLVGAGVGVSRPAHTVSGWVARAGEGPVVPGVWIVGQAAGACGYLGSLASGRRTALRVVEHLRRGDS